MSVIFDARRHAEQSKRAREAVAADLQSGESGASDQREASVSANAVQATFAGVPQRRSVVRSLLRIPRSQPVSSGNRSAYLLQQGRIAPATLISPKDPIYPAIAKEHLISGTVEVQFCISPEGEVYDVRSVRGSPILARAAVEAVKTWRYEPARLNGVPIESRGSTNFDFTLD